MLLYLGATGPTHAISLFLPNIISELGTSNDISFLNSVEQLLFSTSRVLRYLCVLYAYPSVPIVVHIYLLRGRFDGPCGSSRIFYLVRTRLPTSTIFRMLTSLIPQSALLYMGNFFALTPMLFNFDDY